MATSNEVARQSAPQAVQKAGGSQLGTLQGMLERYKHQIAVALLFAGRS